jgi:hypothetical protein
MQITTVGLDLAKNVFQVHGANSSAVRDTSWSDPGPRSIEFNVLIPTFIIVPTHLAVVAVAAVDCIVLKLGADRRRFPKVTFWASPWRAPGVRQP